MEMNRCIQGVSKVGASYIGTVCFITADEARQMPPGTWPIIRPCVRDHNNKVTGNREESIWTDDKGELTRTYRDPSCV